jgi:hypothetical protein
MIVAVESSEAFAVKFHFLNLHILFLLRILLFRQSHRSFELKLLSEMHRQLFSRSLCLSTNIHVLSVFLA